MNGHTDNSIRIAAELGVVWRLTNELERWPDLFTEYASVEILEQRGDTFRFRLTMHPDEQGNAWSWVSERTLDSGRHQVTARRIELGWFEHMDITWTYAAEEGGTRMRWVQDFAMNPQSPVDVAAMTARINANTPVQMRHVRGAVERIAAELTGTGVAS
jgi:aromatase